MLRSLLSRVLVLLAAALSAESAVAEVVSAGENGLALKNTVTVPVETAKAYAAVVEGIGKWWDPAHTYSGDAANLSIEARPQGCFCEKLPGQGFVRHLTVVFAAPGKMLRLEGGLGPFQSMAVAGMMTWTFHAAAEKGSTVELQYTAGGYSPGGFKELAPAVDSVLRDQLERYKRFVETGKP